MKLSLVSAAAGHVAVVHLDEGYVVVEMDDIEQTIEPVDARALAAMLVFAASEATR